ncbi:MULTISPECIES: protein phosphatase 2C domain-containing protein [unclassified Psychrobacter]|uniref:PP2C family protein-serine/threonine phosphatase n=1 Tax=Psychrobacter TaxID=497 RepID=UPI00086BC667|nr:MULTISPECIES: protein phosphatase 2C domain-containing protein [unclassified Psychrobacter]OEH66898.1 MAG: protein phosphatase [Psychrobacter sp. B29-1]PKG67953.1 protein phosphatase [Psychrobacter sp. Choline-02u-13]PKH55098.1 protein phosphatase [Psychrobacter sp. Choline-02u-9]|tara:strand:+ start:3930 stop:4787 length:858 start_codon:yes stop_codon:yes gene_type:complete
MIASSNNCPSWSTSSIAQACAITFQGNASNKLQQDAFFFLDNWYQEDLGMMAVTSAVVPFCLAVSDGVASSHHSQHCSKAVVKAIGRLWNDQKHICSDSIHQLINQTKHLSKRHGAAATLAMVACELNYDGIIKATITHVGDSRVYWLPKGTSQWQCLTRDHNLLNELIDQKAQEQGSQAKFADYNREGMAGSLYSITECFALTADDSYLSSEAPEDSSCQIDINSGDCILVCTDGIHDLVTSHEWQPISAKTDLQAWLINLKNQIYDSDGNAYDNGTAILVRFD